ncbi:MAG: hypothetical protein ACM3UY_11005 [Methanocella sp.]|jgi:hypothetical protein
MSKCSVFLLVFALISSSLIMVQVVGGSASSKPSVPEFTLSYIDHSYDVPPKPSSSTDPYTGEMIDTTIPGYHVENKTIDAYITNNGASYYNFRYKGHYEDEWNYYPFYPNNELGYFLPDAHAVPFHASTSSHTVVSLYFLPYIPVNGKLDIQVQALFGDFRAVPYVHPGGVPGGPTYDFYWEGEASDWSNTQTITIDESTPAVNPDASFPPPSVSPSESQSPITSPGQSGSQMVAQLGLDWMQIAMLVTLGVVAVLLALLVVYLFKCCKK